MFDVDAMKGIVWAYIALAVGGGFWVALIWAISPAVRGLLYSLREKVRR